MGATVSIGIVLVEAGGAGDSVAVGDSGVVAGVGVSVGDGGVAVAAGVGVVLGTAGDGPGGG